MELKELKKIIERVEKVFKDMVISLQIEDDNIIIYIQDKHKNITKYIILDNETTFENYLIQESKIIKDIQYTIEQELQSVLERINFLTIISKNSNEI